MKVCILECRIKKEYLYSSPDTSVNNFLYLLTDNEYKKELGKNNILNDDTALASRIIEYCLEYRLRKFTVGEEVISQYPYFSMIYATEILKGRFIKGEDTISRVPELQTMYKRFLLFSKIAYIAYPLLLSVIVFLIYVNFA